MNKDQLTEQMFYDLQVRVEKPKVTICDANFLPFGRSASLGGDNLHIHPTHFEWEQAPAETARFVTDGNIKDAKGPGQIAWLLEPYELHPESYHIAAQRQDEFDFVLSFEPYVDKFVDQRKWLGFPFGGSWIDFSKWRIHPKTKEISMILSDKKITSGHKLRHEIKDYIVAGVDYFGVGINPIERKIDALAPYKYSIVIESTRHGSYFSEKLIDCLSVGTIPIYYGSNVVLNIFDMDGIIRLSCIQDLDNALQITRNVEHYESCLQSIKNNIRLAKQYAICEDWLYKSYPFLFEGHMK